MVSQAVAKVLQVDWNYILIGSCYGMPGVC